jgi:RNA polymerase sigma factor (sigma-70 family)
LSRGFQVEVAGPADVEQEALAALDRSDRAEALRILMKGYGAALYDHCRRTLRDEALAQDVHQQCFVQAWADLARFARRSTLKAWLFGIAHHRCLDAAKVGRRRIARLHPVAEVPEVVDPAPAAEDRLAQRSLEQALALCLQALAPAARAAVALRYTEGFSYEQMADICGEKAGTLQARVARSMPALRDCLKARGVLHGEE